MSALLYLLMIFVWGFSWIAIKSQQGDVAMAVSIFYRFAIAAILMFVLGKLFNQLQAVKAHHHRFFALQGLCLFCCNFIAFYSATAYIASGLVAVVMATAPIFNAIHGRLFFGTPTSANFWLGAMVGLGGLSLLFATDLVGTQWSQDSLIGLLFALAGTWCFSIGNMISIRNSRHAIGPYTATSYAMFYGCIALLALIFIKGLSFEFDTSLQYIGGLLYLAAPASVIGFTVYLILVDRLGANNAAYLLVITPIVALTVSSLYEGYQWTINSTLGLILVIGGNIIIQRKRAILNNLFSSRRQTNY